MRFGKPRRFNVAMTKDAPPKRVRGYRVLGLNTDAPRLFVYNRRGDWLCAELYTGMLFQTHCSQQGHAKNRQTAAERAVKDFFHQCPPEQRPAFRNLKQSEGKVGDQVFEIIN